MNVTINCDVAGALVPPFPTLHALGLAARVHVPTRVPVQGQEQDRELVLEPGVLDLALLDPGRHGRGPELEQGQGHVPGPSLSAGM
jgi:hypothetical protein